MTLAGFNVTRALNFFGGAGTKQGTYIVGRDCLLRSVLIDVQYSSVANNDDLRITLGFNVNSSLTFDDLDSKITELWIHSNFVTSGFAISYPTLVHPDINIKLKAGQQLILTTNCTGASYNGYLTLYMENYI